MKCTNSKCDGTLTLDLSIEPIPYYRGDNNPRQIELSISCSNHCKKINNPPFSDYSDILYWVQNNYDKIEESE